jgi:hypothetical protein
MRACPFCGFNEGWTKESSYTKPIRYKVICNVCDSSGPESSTPEMAEKKWDGILSKIDDDKKFKAILKEDMGGASTPMTTTVNTPGVGNAQLPKMAAMTGNQQASNDSKGSGDKYGDTPKKKNKKLKEENTNPHNTDPVLDAYKKNGGKPAEPFKKGDSKTNTVVLKNESFQIETLDDYVKASKHVPKHPLQTKKKINEEEETVNDIENLKDVKAKNELIDLNIPFIYKPGPSGNRRVYIKGNVNDAVKKLLDLEWEEVGTNPENSIKKFHKDDKEIAIFADGKDLPRITLKPIQKKTEDTALESIIINKLVSNSLEPYIK